ncbi:SBBP repeat-containing protein [Pontibacter sp. CAU 1760]
MKTRMRFAGLQVLLYLICLTALAQQPKLEWAKRYNGTGNTGDGAVAVAVDEEGNSYVTGTSSGVFPKMTTVKYSPSGKQLWVAQFVGNSIATAIAVDNQGGVFVTGNSYSSDFTSDAYVTVRYDAVTGEQAWASRHEGDSYDQAMAIAVDNQGGVYVTGSSVGETGSFDYATVRYNAATGEQDWVSRYSAHISSAAAIAVDNAGSVYLTGSSYNSDFTGTGYVTVRYDAATGEQVWASRYDKGRFDTSRAIAVDNQGGVFVTGLSYGETGSPDFATVRYDAATGEEAWASRYDGGFSDEVVAIAVDNAGGVYITGSSHNSDFTKTDYATVCYAAATGEEIWASRYDGGSDNQARAIAVDNQGGVYVTGYSYNSDPNTDYATVRYAAATGEQVWASRYDEGRFDISRAIAVDNQGGVYVTGYSVGETGSSDFATIRYDAATGEQAWASRFDEIVSTADRAIAVATDEDGNSYVTGTSSGGFSSITTIKYAPSGEQLWVVQYKHNSIAAAIAVDNQGGVYVTGYSHGETGSPNYATVRYDAATGEQVWAKHYDGGGSDVAVSIAVDNQGGVYITGSSYNSDYTTKDYATVRYDAATGEQVWVQRYDGPEDSLGEATAIAVDNQGGVYVTGYSYNSGFTGTDYATVRYDAATGEQTWVSRYSAATFNAAIAVDNQGGVYVTGASYGADFILGYATVRYDAATGEQTWASRYEGVSYSLAIAIAVDNTGGVYVTGESSNSGFTNKDYATVRYAAATGEEIWASRYDGGSDDQARAIAVDNQGGVYVTGYSSNSDFSGTNYATVRYAAATGEQVWAEHYNSMGSSENVAVDLALDLDDNLIITGYSIGGPETGYDFLTIKYHQCPAVTEIPITGSSTADVSATGSVYSLPAAPGATSFSWSITDPDGAAYAGFTGQGTPSISVDWPDAPNAYKVSVTYSAEEGCSFQTTVLYVHVYDPKAGYITGSGWSHTPVSTDYDLMQNGRKLYWSFLARYRNSASDDVQGPGFFLIESGPYAFRSNSLEDGSLVVSGNRAFYRGQGTLFHQEGFSVRTDKRRFGYLVAATDGDLGEGNDPDMLRLRVWVIKEDGSEGETVYDNQIGCAAGSLDDNAPACQAIDKGNVIIHRSGIRGLASLFSLNAAAAPQELQAYPTTFSDRTTIAFSLEEGEGYKLELYDLKGALVRQLTAGTAERDRRYEHEVRAEGLEEGLYLAKLSTKEKVQTVKLVVQR